MNKEIKGLKVDSCVLPFLPMLYTAWSDEVISPAQIRGIEKVLRSSKCLEPDQRQLVKQWLDPNNPPSPGVLQSWLSYIRENSDKVATNKRCTLSDLGASLVDGKPLPKNCPTRTALNEIETDLGVLGEEAAAEILGKDTAVAKKPKKGAIDTKKLNKFLDGKHAATRKKVRQFFLDPKLSLDRIPEGKDEYRELIFEWCELAAQQGWGALAFPKFAGGKDDVEQYLAVFEELGYHDLSLTIKFGVQFGLWGGSVYWLGTDKHHRKYLKDIGTLALPGSFAMTEGGHGSNVRDIEVTATFDPAKDAFILHTPNELARKEYIGNAAVHARAATVFAQLVTNGESHGVHAFVVPLRDEKGKSLKGIRIEDNGRKLGLNGVDNGRIWFDNVVVPRDNLLDKFGSVDAEGNYSSPITSQSKRFFTMLGTLVGGRVGVPYAGLSAAKLGLAIAIKYAGNRTQFGPSGGDEISILDYTTHQRRLMPLLAKAYAFHFGQRYSMERYVNKTEKDGQEVEAVAAGMKSLCTWFTTEALQECREACGGNGYLWENRFADAKADSEIFTTFEGDNTVLLQLVAKTRLGDFKESFGSMGLVSTMRFVSDIAATKISELNPIITRNVDRKHLLSRSFYTAAFKYRESYLTRLVAQRLSKRVKGGMDSFEAVIECQPMMVDMGKAYIERLVLEQFIAGVKSADKTIQKPLVMLERLYALSMIEENKAWYLENGYIEGRKAVYISKMVDELCLEARGHCPDLVDAFGIPEGLIKAPIATEYPYT